jgi:hypothetical protein
LPITAPIQEPYAIDAAKKADVLVCAADDSAARLTTGFIATAHHRVCCDIGTAVFEAGVAHSHGRRFGADVRIILPLDGCLLCRGGLLDYRGAVRTLVGLPARSPAPEPFPGGRAGSARSWNSIAVGAAIRGLEDLVTGRIRATTWIRLEDEGQGLSVAYPLLGQQLKGGGGQAGECELCVLAGAGDEAA